MFSVKMTHGSLEALRQTEAMLRELPSFITPCELLHVSISGDGFGKPSVGNRRTYSLRGRVRRGRQMLEMKSIIELQYTAELRWQPCVGHLRIADEYYAGEYYGCAENELYVKRGWLSDFPLV